jgi:glycerate dehydrogenase
MERIVFLDRAVIRTALRAPAFQHDWREFPTTAPDQTRDRIRDATIVITNRIPLPADVLADTHDLRLISVAGTGVDGIDLDACRRLGITVVNTRDWCTYAVAEHTFALMFALRRDLLGARARVEAGAWQRHHAFSLVGDRFPTDLCGATLGVIGYGALGWRVATLAHAIGMRVQIAEQRGRSRKCSRRATSCRSTARSRPRRAA